ncbi:hypothetical protein [Nonomuraea rubra]|uniref:hypothetical protein n=1 Tax=Nonomuraea rubra TaxID=46180 RepID=UPI0033E7631B
MSTDIYGFIETRHPHADEGWHEGEAWTVCMPLHPLYDDQDYESFGCLVGVRNRRGRPWITGRRVGNGPCRL